MRIRHASTIDTYDSMDRLLTRTTPASKVDTRIYDQNANLTSFTDRRNMSSSFAYDALDRIVTETYTDNTVIRAYDANSRLVKAADNSGSTLFSYDAAGRLTQTINPVGSVNYTIDALGRVTSRQVAGQAAVAHTYDAAGNLLTAAMGGTSVGFNYDARNLLVSVGRSNGVNTSYSYDPMGRVLNIANGSLDSHAYTYDAAGQRVSKNSTPSQALQTATVSSATYDSENHLTAFGGTTYTYDNNGNRTNDSTGVTYTWDGQNRLKKIVVPSGPQAGTYQFTYDFAGNLIQQGQPGVTKSFVLDNLTNVVYQSDTVGNTFSTVSAQAIDSQLALVFPNGVEFGLTDALGSASTIADQSGSAVGKFYYEPYGQTTLDSSTTALAAMYPFLFTGRVPVEGTIYYHRARFYDSVAGRFLSEDPIGFRGGLNLYGYTGDSPGIRTDPSGLDYLNVLSNVAAGAGDNISFGITKLIREDMGTNQFIDQGGSAYNAGEVIGVVWWTALGGALTSTSVASELGNMTLVDAKYQELGLEGLSEAEKFESLGGYNGAYRQTLRNLLDPEWYPTFLRNLKSLPTKGGWGGLAGLARGSLNWYWSFIVTRQSQQCH